MVTTVLTGCAIGNRYIALRYEPILMQKATSSQKVAIVKFSDMRKTPEVGEVRNAYGIKLASVLVKDQDVGAWVANALADELTKAGYEIQKFQDAAPLDINIVITGSVPEAYTRMYMKSTTIVKANITVTRANVVVLNKEYTGKASVLALTGSTGEYENVMKKALQNLMKEMTPDVISAIEK
jgi:hypothetical protein